MTKNSRVYILQSSDSDNGNDIIQVYSTDKLAKKALFRICGKHGFDFCVLPYDVDNDSSNEEYIYCPNLYLARKNLTNWDELWQIVVEELDQDKSDTLIALVKYQADLALWIKEHNNRIKEKNKSLEIKFNDHSDLYESHPKPLLKL